MQIDPKRASGQVSVLAQDEPGGPFRLTRHPAAAEGQARFRDASGLAVYEGDEGQIVHRPHGITREHAEHVIKAHGEPRA